MFCSISLLYEGHQTEAGSSCIIVIGAIATEVELLIKYEERLVSVSDSAEVSDHLFLYREVLVRVVACCVVAMHHEATVSHAVDAHVHHRLALDRPRPFAACLLAEVF